MKNSWFGNKKPYDEVYVEEFSNLYETSSEEIVSLLESEDNKFKKGSYKILEISTNEHIATYTAKSEKEAVLKAAIIHGRKEIFLGNEYKAEFVEKDGWDTW